MQSILKPPPQYYSHSIPSQRPNSVYDSGFIPFDQLLANNDDGYVLLDNTGAISQLNNKAKKILNLKEISQSNNHSPLFINSIKQQFKMIRPRGWKNWLEAGRILHLVKPQSENENAQWIKVKTLPLDGDRLGRHLLCLKDCSDLVFLNQKICCFEHNLNHTMSLPLKTLTNTLTILKQAAAQCMANDLYDIFATASESGEYLSLIFLHFADSLRQKNPGNRNSSSILKRLMDEQINRLEYNMPSQQTISVDLPKNLENLRLGYKEELFTIILTKILILLQQFHPENAPRLRLKITSILEGTSLAITIKTDYCFGVEEAITDLQTPEWDPIKNLTEQPDSLKKGLRAIDCLMLSLGGFYAIKSPTEDGITEITLAIPIITENER